MTKVFILALDGLEYNLVNRYSLAALKQAHYGKIELTGVEEILTPIIWGTFVTGKIQAKKKVTIKKWDKNLVNRVSRCLSWLGLNRIKGKGGILEFFRLAKRIDHTIEDYTTRGETTIFDLAKNPVSIQVPTINDRGLFRKTAPLLGEVLSNPQNERRYLNRFWEDYRTIKAQIYERLSGDWDLFMVHFQLLDILGHLYAGRGGIQLFKGYSTMNWLAHDLQKAILPSDVHFLIISDHGMKPLGRFGDHSDYGFWSSNRVILGNPFHVTRFFDIIVKSLV